MKYSILLLLLIPNYLLSQVEKGTLLGSWSDSTLVASDAHNNTYNEIWGLAINGKEYAIIGSTKGTHILDVTAPEKPELLFTIDGGTQGRSIIHRDFHHYGCYLYAIADEGRTSTLQIIDISSLPDEIDVVYDNADIVTTSHNMFIDSSRAKLYFLAVSGTNGRSAMQIFDIEEDPTNPIFLGSYSKFGDIQASHVHDAFIQNDTAYLNCGNQGFAVVDFSDTNNPITLGTMRPDEYPNSGYNHSGWTSDDGNYYYMADENHGSPMKVVDISNMDNLHVTKQFNAQTNDINNSIAHNPIVACNYLYVAYYYDGLQVYDISTPSDPELVMHYPTSTLTNDRRYRGAWGVYPFLPSGNILVSDMQNGLFVIESIDVEYNCDGIVTCTELTDVKSLSVDHQVIISHENNELHFKINDVQGNTNVQVNISSLSGQLVQRNIIKTQEGISDYSLSLNNPINSGLYIVELNHDDDIYIKKIFLK